MVDPAVPPELGQTVAVEAARPVQVARAVVLLRPLALEQSLGPTVLKLLPPIRADGIAAVMPDDRRVSKTEARAGCLEPPAHIDVIAGYPKLRIESPDRAKRRRAKRHVAARDVLRFTIREQHVDRTAGRASDAVRDDAVPRRREIWSTHPRVCRRQKGRRQIREPIRIGVGIVVRVGDDLAGRRFKAGVAGTGQAAVLGPDYAKAGLPGELGRTVGRAVVDHDDLVVRVSEPLECLEAIADGPRTVVRAHDHRDSRPRGSRCEGHLGECAPHRVERRLRRTVGAREPETPVLDVVALPVPLVGPREHEGARASVGERRPHLPVHRTRLRLLAVAQTV